MTQGDICKMQCLCREALPIAANQTEFLAQPQCQKCGVASWIPGQVSYDFSGRLTTLQTGIGFPFPACMPCYNADGVWNILKSLSQKQGFCNVFNCILLLCTTRVFSDRSEDLYSAQVAEKALDVLQLKSGRILST